MYGTTHYFVAKCVTSFSDLLTVNEILFRDFFELKLFQFTTVDIIISFAVQSESFNAPARKMCVILRDFNDTVIS